MFIGFLRDRAAVKPAPVRCPALLGMRGSVSSLAVLALVLAILFLWPHLAAADEDAEETEAPQLGASVSPQDEGEASAPDDDAASREEGGAPTQGESVAPHGEDGGSAIGADIPSQQEGEAPQLGSHAAPGAGFWHRGEGEPADSGGSRSPRRYSPFMEPGERELTFDFSWKKSPHDEEQRVEEFALDLRAEFGILERMSGFVDIPFSSVWTSTSGESDEELESGSGRQTGLGDIEAGAVVQLLAETRRRPELDLTLGVTFPTSTGNSRTTSFPEQDIDTGHWGFTGGLTLTKLIGPFRPYCGVSHTRYLSASQNGEQVTPGSETDLDLGLEWEMVSDVSLLLDYSYSIVGRTSVDSTPLEDSASYPASIRTGLGLALWERLYLEPYVSFGLNRDAYAFESGLSLTIPF